jgi:hypothetical protein
MPLSVQRFVTRFFGVGVAAAFWAIAAIGYAQPLPRFDGSKHLGVASCAGPCHARQSALGLAEGADMRGSEIVVWQDADTSRGRHSSAFAVLRQPRGRDIAAKLGIGPAESAAECLSCHADFPSSANRGERFQLSDGVGCEACHGGSEKWLSTHFAPGATHAQNVANGLFDTADPVKRARLCQSCHLGASPADQYVTHRLMGAGHPRLSFELELFTNLQAHHFEDADYASRKPIAPRARVWAIGQAQSMGESVRLFLSDRGKAGVFPELTFYDCHSCHRPISDRQDYRSRWTPNAGRGTGPGHAAFNDGSLIMTIAAARAFDPKLADELDAKGMAFQMAMLKGPKETAEAGVALQRGLVQASALFSRSSFTPQQTQAILRNIVASALNERFTAYQGAEQAIMAIDSLSRAMVDGGGGYARAANNARGSIEAAYGAVSDPNTYDPAAFKVKLNAIASRLGVA